MVIIICGSDLCSGVIFFIDYGRFSEKAYDYNLASYEAGVRDPDAVQLIAGQMSALLMMMISFKGVVLWIINFGLMVHLFKQVSALGDFFNENVSFVIYFKT